MAHNLSAFLTLNAGCSGEPGPKMAKKHCLCVPKSQAKAMDFEKIAKF